MAQVQGLIANSQQLIVVQARTDASKSRRQLFVGLTGATTTEEVPWEFSH